MNSKNYIKIFSIILMITSKTFSQDVTSEIETQLENIYSLAYSISTLVNVDSAMAYSDTSYFNFSKYSDDEITDPYGTLKGTYIFAALRDYKRNLTGKVVGIYKDSEIKWISDTLVYSKGSLSTLHRTYDLNLNGNVEIIITWDDDVFMNNPNINPKTMWVFSWDGKTGYPINEIDWLSSKLLSFSPFEFVDYDGDGIMELTGEEEDEYGESKKIFWVWNGSKYVSSPPLEPVYINRRNATAKLLCSVKKENGKYLYRYVIKNDESSKRRIQDIHIETNDIEIVNFHSNNSAWNFYSPKQNSSLPTVSWVTSGLQGYTPIEVGGIREGYAFSSSVLPSVQKFYILSENIGISNPESHIWDVLNNSTGGYTIAPKLLPSLFTPSEFLDTLISYTAKSFDFYWIENEGTFNKLMEKLENAKDHISKGNNRQTIKLLNDLLKEVAKQNGKRLTSEAFALLYYNAEYLITQIPAENLTIESISPSITIEKTKDFTLTVHGSDFTRKSEVHWNGKKKKTKFISENVLEAKIKDKDVKKEGIYTVHVSEKKVGRTEELEFRIYKKLPERLIPVLNCIEELDEKKHLAWFGYENYNDGIVLLDGKENEIKGGKKKKGEPPVIFMPGIHEKVFSVEYDDKKKLKWELLKEKAEVKEDTPICQ